MLAVIDIGISFRTPSRGTGGTATSKVRIELQCSAAAVQLRPNAWKQGKSLADLLEQAAKLHQFQRAR
tara:strand:- start:494 stop:697 length:204 start_codon:yes stop_codon:yes gene_type:complete